MNKEEIAKVCHNANKAFCESIGDMSQPFWEDAPDWQKESAIRGVELHINNPAADAGASHRSWMDQKLNDGWCYGPEKNPEEKTHPSLVPYENLSVNEQTKDHIFRSVVHALYQTKNS